MKLVKYNWCQVVYVLAILCVSCTNSASQFESLKNSHVIYKGVIDNYSVGPQFYSAKEIVMELWFPEQEFIYGYWKEINSNYKHYLKGKFTSLKQMYGSDASFQRKCNKREYSLYFNEMSDKNAKYRILLEEYYDEHFSKITTDCLQFYVYNFEDGKLQGSYYTWHSVEVSNGKDTWITHFRTIFNLKRTN